MFGHSVRQRRVVARADNSFYCSLASKHACRVHAEGPAGRRRGLLPPGRRGEQQAHAVAVPRRQARGFGLVDRMSVRYRNRFSPERLPHQMLKGDGRWAMRGAGGRVKLYCCNSHATHLGFLSRCVAPCRSLCRAASRSIASRLSAHRVELVVGRVPRHPRPVALARGAPLPGGHIHRALRAREGRPEGGHPAWRRRDERGVWVCSRPCPQHRRRRRADARTVVSVESGTSSATTRCDSGFASERSCLSSLFSHSHRSQRACTPPAWARPHTSVPSTSGRRAAGRGASRGRPPRRRQKPPRAPPRCPARDRRVRALDALCSNLLPVPMVRAVKRAGAAVGSSARRVASAPRDSRSSQISRCCPLRSCAKRAARCNGVHPNAAACIEATRRQARACGGRFRGAMGARASLLLVHLHIPGALLQQESNRVELRRGA